MPTGQNLTTKQTIDVVALALKCQSDQKIMLARRGPNESGAGHWEFPGGKIEKNESQEEALRREIIEELGFDIGHLGLTFLGESLCHYENKSIRIYLWKAEIQQKPQFILVDHDMIDWFDKTEIQKINLSPGDKPFISLM